MAGLTEQFMAWCWNRLANGKQAAPQAGLNLGFAFSDGQRLSSYTVIPELRRTEHIAILGKTGTGKSSLLRYAARQDIEQGRGFVYFDLHGDTTPYLLRVISRCRRSHPEDLSRRTIVIEPGDPEFSIGLNVLDQRGHQQNFVQTAEFAQILKTRWHLDSFGARTEELLRSSLLALTDAGQTLLELPLLLTNARFRSACLDRTQNAEVREYFESRFNRASEAQQHVFRDAILNKVSAFTADPHFRHILGQQRSTFSLSEAIDQGYWVILNLDKGRLGEQAATLGSLFLTRIKNALFGRRSHNLFTLYCDEIQNLVAFDSGLDTLLSEARKFSISIFSANQFLEQYPPAMRSAILAVGTHICFALSSSDADRLAAAFDGGKTLGEILKHLPQRHFVIKSGHHRWKRGVVPQIETPAEDFSNLMSSVRARWAKPRTAVEQEIEARRAVYRQRGQREDLNDWD